MLSGVQQQPLRREQGAVEGEEGESEAQGWAGTGSAATEMALQGMGKLLDVDNQKNWRAQGSL